MTYLDYFEPRSLNEAISLLDKHGNDLQILNGGTDLVLKMNREEINPKILMSIRKLKELNFIKKDNGNIRIGGIVTFTDILENDLINNGAQQVLSLACQSVGSTQIRNMGTIAGNILTASPAADTVPTLLALNAKIVLESAKGTRTINIEDIFSGSHQTKIKDNEILTEISFKSLDDENNIYYSGYRKLGRRKALAISRVSVAIIVEQNRAKNSCKDARIALGAVASNPFRAKEVEEIIKNREFNEKMIQECINKISEVAEKTLDGRPSTSFKKESIKGVSKEVLMDIFRQINSN